jgi:hypothetical protein
MTRDDWDTIFILDEQQISITYPWQFVCEINGDWTSLRFTADGLWDCLGDAVKPCGPNGHVDLPFQQDRLLVAAAAPGTLIGKLGGSIAGRTDGTTFAIGSRCVVLREMQKKTMAVYIGINGAVAHASNVLNRLKLEICGVVDG